MTKQLDHAMTNSARSAAGCKQRWLFAYGLGVSPLRKSRPLTFGSMWHELMEVYHKHGIKAALGVLQDLREEAKANDLISLNSPLSIELDGGEDVIYDDLQDALFRYDAKWFREEPWYIMSNEQSVCVPVVTPRGRRSKKTHVAGRVDKIIYDDKPEFMGRNVEVWVGEHKSTSLDLDDWLHKHEYRPQTLTYAWLVEQKYPGIKVRGAIYDIMRRKTPLKFDELKTVKDGSRLRKTNGLPNTTYDQFCKALQHHGFSQGDQPWYSDIMDGLRARELRGYWFKRATLPFTQEEIRRTGRELYYASNEMRGWYELAEEYRPLLRIETVDGGATLDGHGLVKVLNDIGDRFPRNPSLCHEYGRCRYMDLCRERSVEAAYTMRLKTSTHEELED